MASIKFPINSEVLRWAIQNSDCDIYVLLEKFPKLNDWLSQDEIPTFKQLESLSKKLHIPLGYIILDEPPDEKIELLDFRTVENSIIEKPSRNLIDTIYTMQERQEWMHDYMLSEDEMQLDFIGSVSKKENHKDIAKKIRTNLELALDWYKSNKTASDAFNTLRDKLETKGIIVMVNGIVGTNTHRPLNVEEFRAFTIVDKYAPLIFINGKDTANGRLFSLCHELTHLWLGENSLYNETFRLEQKYRNDLEVKCNAVAAEILVPNTEFTQKWFENKNKNEEKITELSQIFNVSKIVIARRALDNRFIAKDQYIKISKTITQIAKKSSKNDGGNFYNTAKYNIDNRFFQAVNRSLKQGRTAFTEAYRLTGFSGKSYDQVERLIGG